MAHPFLGLLNPTTIGHLGLGKRLELLLAFVLRWYRSISSCVVDVAHRPHISQIVPGAPPPMACYARDVLSWTDYAREASGLVQNGVKEHS